MDQIPGELNHWIYKEMKNNKHGKIQSFGNC